MDTEPFKQILAGSGDAVIFVIIVAISIISQIVKALKKGGASAAPPSPATGGAPPAVLRTPTASSEDELKKFLRNLGMPVEAKSVAPVSSPPPIPPPVPSSPVRSRPPVVGRTASRPVTSPESVQRLAVPAIKKQVTPHSSVSEVQPLIEEVHRVKGQGSTKEGESGYSNGHSSEFLDLPGLRDPSAMRRAIILKEILGPPIALRQ